MAPNKQKGSNRSPASPAVAAPPKPSLDDLFLSLDRHVQANEYKQIVKVADQILVDSPGDLDALQCKIVSLIQDERIDDAISAINSVHDSNASSFKSQKAYCLYKKNALQEAISALEGLERNDDILQLEAQIYYRLGDFNACIESYNRLSNLDSSELKTNLIASYISGGRSNEVSVLMQKLKVTPRSGFELAYNAACASIENNDFAKAEELLLLARRIGQEMLIEEEFTNDEVENELAPISVQLAFVQQAQDRTTEAVEAYNQLLKQKLADAPSMAVAYNNLVVLKRNKEISDSLRKLDNLFDKKTSEEGLRFTDALEHRLSARQKEALAFNRFLLLLLGNKLDQVRELLPALFSKFPNSCIPPILSASLLVREGKLTRAEEMLGQYLEKHPNDERMLLLARAQIAAQAGHNIVAAQSLEKISDLQHKPGMVATLVALKERGGDPNGAEATLDAAVQWWENHMGENTEATLELFAKEAADLKLKHKNMEGASLLFQKLARSASKEVRGEALTGLIRSVVHTDIRKAEEYEKQLPALAGTGAIDVASLEEKGIAGTGGGTGSGIGVKRNHWAAENGGGEEGRAKHKRRRKRKPRYPKGFDPANPGPPPDPERWLPLRERSSFRPKRKDKRAQLRGAQGSVAASKAVPSSTVTSTNAASASSSKAPPPAASKAVQQTEQPSKPTAAAASTSGSSKPSAKSKKKSRR